MRRSVRPWQISPPYCGSSHLRRGRGTAGTPMHASPSPLANALRARSVRRAYGRLRRGRGRSRARPGPRRHGRHLALDGGLGGPHVARALASRSIAECEDLARRVASARTPEAARAIAAESLAGAIG